MYQLMYLSQATRPLARSELARLGEVARRNDARDAISGVLVSWNDCFLQILEGPSHRVEATFERIVRDPRHADVHVLVTGLVPKRRFDEGALRWAALADATGPMRGLFDRHPALSMTNPHWRDPMLAFALLYDVAFHLGDEAWRRAA